MRHHPLLLLVLVAACASESPVETSSTDRTLFALATASGPWRYWRDRPDTLASSPASGHGERWLRTRYDTRAATQLDASGRVRQNPAFPDSSLIVKALYTNGRVTTYAVMLKLRGGALASESGWLWAELDSLGNAKISATERGGRCVSCHSLARATDFTRMNDAQP